MSDTPVHVARIGLSVLIVLWVTAAAGLLLEGLTRFAAFRVLFVTGLGLGGALYWRANKHGGLPSSLVDFDTIAGPPRPTVHVAAPADL